MPGTDSVLPIQQDLRIHLSKSKSWIKAISTKAQTRPTFETTNENQQTRIKYQSTVISVNLKIKAK